MGANGIWEMCRVSERGTNRTWLQLARSCTILIHQGSMILRLDKCEGMQQGFQGGSGAAR